MRKSFDPVLVLLWLTLEALLTWTVLYNEIEVFTLGHFAMLAGVLFAVFLSRRDSESGRLGLGGGPPRVKVHVMPIRPKRAA
jgi:hypothetical protein